MLFCLCSGLLDIFLTLWTIFTIQILLLNYNSIELFNPFFVCVFLSLAFALIRIQFCSPALGFIYFYNIQFSWLVVVVIDDINSYFDSSSPWFKLSLFGFAVNQILSTESASSSELISSPNSISSSKPSSTKVTVSLIRTDSGNSP